MKRFSALSFVLFFSLIILGCAPSEKDIIDAAKPLVEQIIKENIDDLNYVECTDIKKLKKTDDGEYSAKAYVTAHSDDGTEKGILDIKIELIDSDIVVTIDFSTYVEMK